MMRERERVTVTFKKPSRTQQSFKDECDINNIMARYERTGIVDHLAKYEGQYGDFIGYPDYHVAMNRVAAADAMFMTLPASLRERFGNSAEAFLQFAQDPANELELIDMGLMPRRPVEAMPSSVADAPAKPVKTEPKAKSAEPKEASSEE